MNKYKITYGGDTPYINLNDYTQQFNETIIDGKIIHVIDDPTIIGAELFEIYINDSNLENEDQQNKYKLIETQLTDEQYKNIKYQLQFENNYWKVKYNGQINNYKPPTGIENIGNTCFVNSVFQFLYAMPEYI